MGRTLTAQILDAHRAPTDLPVEDGAWLIRPDHVVLDRAHATWALGALDALDVGRPRVDATLISVDRIEGSVRFEPSGEVGDLLARAVRRGIGIARMGRCGIERIHRARLAAPGKLGLSACGVPPSAGALGQLMLETGPIESVAALAGCPIAAGPLAVLRVSLAGTLPPWVSGADVGLALVRTLAPERVHGAVIEFGGGGCSALAVSDRIAIAAALAARGARAALFPSDERTRAYLKHHRREADWKALAADPDAEFELDLDIDLDAIEPMLAPVDDLESCRRVRSAAGAPLRRVVVGPRATLADLERVASAFVDQRIASHTELIVVPTDRDLEESAAAAGVIDRLVQAGARWLEAPDLHGWDAASERPGWGLACGVDRESLPGRGMHWYWASPESCAAGARFGWIADPRELGAEGGVNRDDAAEVGAEAWIVAQTSAPAATAETNAAPAAPPAPSGAAPTNGATSGATSGHGFPIPRPIVGPTRGVVLAVLGDHVDQSMLLARGARVDAVGTAPESLAPHLLERTERDFARHAQSRGGGIIVAGSNFGDGAGPDAAAMTLAWLEVDTIVARSYAPTFHRALLESGVLPLVVRRASDLGAFERGDEIEIPGLPFGLEPAKPVVARNLTRGTQMALGHSLTPREIAIVRAGGIWGLRPASARGPARDAESTAGGKG